MNLFFFQAIADALQSESTFLQKNYPPIANRNGTPFLAKTLNRVKFFFFLKFERFFFGLVIDASYSRLSSGVEDSIESNGVAFSISCQFIWRTN